jgi:uncharacterized protein YndB with AHSA1/START domain
MPTNIRKTIFIKANIENIWAALTEPKAIEAWMGGEKIKVTLRKGGNFALFGGETTGKFMEIRRPNTLEYTWRQHTWEKEWVDSVVRWELNPKGKGTYVRLVHSQLPNKEERDSHEEGWDAYWLTPMKAWLEKK